MERLKLKQSLIDQLKINIELSKILHKPTSKQAVYSNTNRQEHLIKTVLDQQLIKKCQPALRKGQPVRIDPMKINNRNRATGTMLGSYISKHYGAKGLVKDSIKLKFVGTAGQSFGAFIPPGLSLFLHGAGNDYVGKGLSGGKIVIRPPEDAGFQADKAAIVGNTCLYGATSGQAFIAGMAGQRFAVRNSGCDAVVEGVRDHGCEYMTGGRVVILGAVGKNFAAGMSGGLAFVL